MKRFLFILVLILISVPQTSFGQFESISADSVKNRVDSSVSPKYPGPNELVTIKINSYSEETTSLRFNWSLDGISELSGLGENIFVFTTREEGSSHRVFVSIQGQSISTSKTFDFSIGSVDLVLEPYSYTHPFYKGKTFTSYDSDVSVVAIPNVSGASRENLYYTWKQDGTTLGSASGRGRSSLLVTSSYLIRPKNIEVLVGKSPNSVSATNSIAIEPRDTQVLLYEDSPLYGRLYNQAIQEANLIQNEISVVAEPYFFSSAGTYPFLTFIWKINNELIPNSQNILTLRNDSGSTGSSRISVEAKNTLSILESAKTNSLINF